MNSRRDFIRMSTLVGAGLLIEMKLPLSSQAASKNEAFEPNAWLKIFADGRYIFILDRAEMGQGVMTALPILLAEELDINPLKLEVENAPADRRYANDDLSMQITGGSTSVHSSWGPLRKAGASARQVFMEAAAKQWNVRISECTTDDGVVFHKSSRRLLPYHQLLTQAALLKVKEAELKKPTDFKYIGKINSRRENSLKVTGRAQFGIDVTLPNLLVAVVVRCPFLGGSVKSFQSDKANGSPGFKGAYQIFNGIAVVATGYWQAREAAKLLEIQWDETHKNALSSASIREMYVKAILGDSKKVRSDGNIEKTFNNAAIKIEAIYECPYLAHATMEPQNCTAHVTDDSCEIWAPTQSPALAHQWAVELTKLDAEKIKVHTTFLGGGFGRRLAQDYVHEAIEISMAAKAPIKLIWSREDDIKNDIYRPNSYHVLHGAVDGTQAVGWSHHIAAQSILSQVLPEWLPAMLPSWVPQKLKAFAGKGVGKAHTGLIADDTSVEGAKDLHYDIPNLEVRYSCVEPGVPIGFWRSVGHSFNAFVTESFIDELAHAAKQDPYLFRAAQLKKSPALLEVLQTVAVASGWPHSPTEKNFQGIACHSSFRSHAAAVAEVKVEGNSYRVTRLVAAINCGRIINPDMVKAQIESSVIFALSAAMYGEITWEDGAVQQSNFYDYQVLRINEAPQIDVHLVHSENDPSGVGEPGVPPIAPAVANAIFAATGKRLRTLPLRIA